MANSLVQPFKGSLTLDFTALGGILVDVVAGGTRGLRREKTGIAAVLAELQKNIPAYAETLGVDPALFNRINTKTENLALVRAARVIVNKLSEVLDETEIYLEDEREGDIGIVVKAARDASRRKDPSILAAFEETIKYHGQNALRAQATRRKNEEAVDNEATIAPLAAPPAAAPQSP